MVVLLHPTCRSLSVECESIYVRQLKPCRPPADRNIETCRYGTGQVVHSCKTNVCRPLVPQQSETQNKKLKGEEGVGEDIVLSPEW